MLLRFNLRIYLFSLIIGSYFGSIIYAQSPYEISWNNDGYLLGGSIITAIAASAIDKDFFAYAINTDEYRLHFDDVKSLSRESVNWFDRSATYNFSKNISNISDALVIAAVLSPFSLLIDERISSDWQTITVMYIETTLLSTFVPSFGKGAVLRYRPLVYNPEVPFENKAVSDPKRSFFSGHTTWAFASALFISTVYDEYYPDSDISSFFWGGSLLFASAIGYLRYESGWHYPSDILTGAAVGSAIGFLIPYLHKDRDGSLSVIPTAASDYFSINLKYNF